MGLFPLFVFKGNFSQEGIKMAKIAEKREFLEVFRFVGKIYFSLCVPLKRKRPLVPSSLFGLKKKIKKLHEGAL